MIIGQIHNLHVTGISTWCLCYLHNCMLWDWYNNINNCDCELGISYCSTYYFQLCFSEINPCCMDSVSFVSAGLFAVWVSIHVYRSLEAVSFTICSPFCNCRCTLRPCTWTAARIFAWDTSVDMVNTSVDMVKTCSFTTAKLVSNSYSLCSTISHLVFFHVLILSL